MGVASTTEEPAMAMFRFGQPDLSVSAEERCFLTFPGTKDIQEIDLPLLDAYNSPELTQGFAGLDVQGFTYIKHHSTIIESGKLAEGTNIEDFYIPELERLVLEQTGAKSVAVLACSIRDKIDTEQKDPLFVRRRGCEVDEMFRKNPQNTVSINRESGIFEPNRKPHIDFTLQGVSAMMRCGRKDINEMAKAALNAEDVGQPGKHRYACYSIWRPLRVVKRDPLAVADRRTVLPTELLNAEMRCYGEVKPEFLVGCVFVLPPEDKARQRWYWVPDQGIDDVLFIKIADSQSEIDPNVSAGCPHVSPYLYGIDESEPARASVETRVIVFW